MNTKRNFLKTVLIALSSFFISDNKLFAQDNFFHILSVVQKDLLPISETLNSNATNYMTLILHHSLIDDKEKKRLRKGLVLLNNKAIKLYKVPYTNLSRDQRQNVLKVFVTKKSQKKWVESIIAYTMEAILGDPIYGINKNERGWEWLNHTSGLPRPKEPIL